MEPNLTSSSEEQPRDPNVLRIEEKIWSGLDQKNILSQAFSIIPDNLRALRIINLVIHIGTLVWLFFHIPMVLFPSVPSLGLHISIWGFLINISYLILVFKFENAGPYSLSWKITYIIGEVSASLAFLISFSFLGYLLPNIAVDDSVHVTLSDIALLMIINLVCPILIWADMMFNYFKFPRQHFRFLVITLTAYMLVQMIATFQTEKHIYPGIDWKSFGSFFMTGLGYAFAILGFIFGNFQYRWKVGKEAKNIVTTLQMNEVSSPEKISQYHPISFDI